MKAIFEVEGARHELTPQRRAGGVDVVVDGRRHAAELRELGPAERLLTLDGVPRRVFVAATGDELHVHVDGRSFRVRRVSERGAASGGGHAADVVMAPMPGTVIRVAAQAGDAVKRGDLLLAIESMKLETQIRAPRDGVVERIAVAAGATFDRGALLAALVPVGEG